MAGKTVVKSPRSEDAIAANVAGATDGLVYRVDMCMGAGRPYTEVVMTVGFPGPFTLITHNPKARLPSTHVVRHLGCYFASTHVVRHLGYYFCNVLPSVLAVHMDGLGECARHDHAFSSRGPVLHIE